MPIEATPSSQAGSTWPAESTSQARTPSRSATSRRRLEFELVADPITSTASTPAWASFFTASWRFCVA